VSDQVTKKTSVSLKRAPLGVPVLKAQVVFELVEFTDSSLEAKRAFGSQPTPAVIFIILFIFDLVVFVGLVPD